MSSRVPVFFAVAVLLMSGAALGGCADSETPAGGSWKGIGFDPSEPGPVAWFTFDGHAQNRTPLSLTGVNEGVPSFGAGLDEGALRFLPGGTSQALAFDAEALPLGGCEDFSIQFWVKSDAGAGEKFVLLSQKDFPDNSLASQKNPGWVLDCPPLVIPSHNIDLICLLNLTATR